MMRRPVLPLAILLFFSLLGYNNCAGPLPDLAADSSSVVFSAAAKQTLAFSELTKVEAVGGTPPYTYSIVSPAQGTITQQGMYTAPPSAGSDQIQITDSNGAVVRISVTIVNGGTTGPGSCLLPWGGTIANNGTVTAFQSAQATCPAACVSQTRSCSNGTLSGTYTARSCGSTCPVAVNDSAKVVGPSTSGNVLANDSIPAGGARIIQVTYTNTSMGSQTQPIPQGATVQINKYAGGTAYLTMSGNGAFTFYCPNAPSEPGCQGTQSIVYRVQDAAGRTADATLSIAP
jgi:hypothetical protein